jgi:predicted transcriptional regulator
MKIKVIERGETEFTASTEWTEPDIRAALAADDKDGNVRSAIYDTTDTERDTDTDEYITITEDDGTVLWSGWLSGHLKDKAAPGAVELERDEARSVVVEMIAHWEHIGTTREEDELIPQWRGRAGLGAS